MSNTNIGLVLDCTDPEVLAEFCVCDAGQSAN
ncbi:hypothetical protein BH20ACT2_BH20ACT2_04430 [soil metagenome]